MKRAYAYDILQLTTTFYTIGLLTSLNEYLELQHYLLRKDGYIQ
jgi:hypothetical protein